MKTAQAATTGNKAFTKGEGRLVIKAKFSTTSSRTLQH